LSLKVHIFLFLAISFLGCTKEEGKKIIPTYSISKSLYPYLFSQGSFWVYMKTNSNDLDYISVISISRDYFYVPPSTPGQGIRAYEEFYTIRYSSSLTGFYDEQLFGYVISRGLYNGGFVFLSGKTIGDKRMNAELTDVIDTLTVEHKMYKQVTKMKIKSDQYIVGNFNLYYADSVGIVRKEKTENDSITETWNLIEFNTALVKKN
jgi:hypothetical protein